MVAEVLCAAVMSLGLPNAEFACKHMDLVVEVAQERDIKPEILVALIHVESRWKPKARSKANACGLTQVIPRFTGGRATERIPYTCKELYNPVRSIQVGGQIFSYWLHRYGRCGTGKCRTQNYTIGLCGYNAGYRCKGKNPNQNGMNYSRSVLRKARQIQRAVKRAEDAAGT